MIEKCPVCYGKGIVSPGFYNTPGMNWSTSSASAEQCRSCNGQGYIVMECEG